MLIDGYNITTLDTKKDLETEGRVMRHSVAKYWPAVERERVVIISVKDAMSNMRVATGKLDKGADGWPLVLLVGPRNNKVDKKVRRAALQFADQYSKPLI